LIDQVIIFDVTLPTIYRLVKNTLENLFDILPPFELRQALKERETNPARLEAITAGFAARSAQMLQGCIGAIDGLLVPIKRPGHLEYERAFYTRKNFYAMNVQAIADVRGRIIHAQVAATPGACHDSYAWRQDQLSKDLSCGFQTAVTVAMKLHNLCISDESSLSTDLSSPNPRLARAERLGGDKEAGKAEESAAWYPIGHTDALFSPRDPKHGDPNAVCEARDKATKKLRNPREDITRVMREYGITRRTPKHW